MISYLGSECVRISRGRFDKSMAGAVSAAILLSYRIGIITNYEQI